MSKHEDSYRLVAQQPTSNVYSHPNGGKLILVKVNRTYTRKPPTYYLKRSIKGSKPEYISGLFPTANPTEFSGDIKDPNTGMKNMFKVCFHEGGDRLTIEGIDLEGGRA
ncbi:MAG: hypothetical protein K9M94_14690 [Spirochaetia bacterium]|nr:hypothetical protein [Spirochaetia bacterium]